jgi:putative ABC transport system permease protein
VGPVARRLTAPLARLRGATALIASSAATASARRTAAIAAPVLVTVGLAASLLTASALTDSARLALRHAPVAADYLVVPDATVGLDRELTRSLPDAKIVTPTAVYTLEGDTALIRRPAEAVTWVADDAILVAGDWNLRPGDTAHVWLADGSPAALRVVGVLPLGSPVDAYVGAGRAFSARPSVAYISGDVDRASLTALVAGHHASVMTEAQWAASAGAGHSASRTGLLVVLAIILAYTTLALVNTLLMAAPDRAGERRALHLLGATHSQVLRATALEVLIAFSTGVVLALLCFLTSTAGLWLALLRVAGPLPIAFPWVAVGGITAGSAALAVLTALLAARRPARTA